MAMIDEYLDPETVRLLCKAFGGSTVKVPSKRSGSAWDRFAESLGEERAWSMVRYMGGEPIYIPQAPDERIKDSVIALRAAGVPVSEIARIAFPRRLSESQINRFCRADKAERMKKNA